MFTEDTMDAYVGEFTDAGGALLYGDARVDAASAAWGYDANILTINNVGVKKPFWRMMRQRSKTLKSLKNSNKVLL